MTPRELGVLLAVLDDHSLDRRDARKCHAEAAIRGDGPALAREVIDLHNKLRAAAVSEVDSEAYWQAVASYRAEQDENALLRKLVAALGERLDAHEMNHCASYGESCTTCATEEDFAYPHADDCAVPGLITTAKEVGKGSIEALAKWGAE